MLPSLSLEDGTVAVASALVLGGSTTSHPVFRLPEAVVSFAQQGKETRKAFWTPHRHGGVSTEAGGSPPKVLPSQDWQAALPVSWDISRPAAQEPRGISIWGLCCCWDFSPVASVTVLSHGAQAQPVS